MRILYAIGSATSLRGPCGPRPQISGYLAPLRIKVCCRDQGLRARRPSSCRHAHAQLAEPHAAEGRPHRGCHAAAGFDYGTLCRVGKSHDARVAGAEDRIDASASPALLSLDRTIFCHGRTLDRAVCRDTVFTPGRSFATGCFILPATSAG